MLSRWLKCAPYINIAGILECMLRVSWDIQICIYVHLDICMYVRRSVFIARLISNFYGFIYSVYKKRINSIFHCFNTHIFRFYRFCLEFLFFFFWFSWGIWDFKDELCYAAVDWLLQFKCETQHLLVNIIL